MEKQKITVLACNERRGRSERLCGDTQTASWKHTSAGDQGWKYRLEIYNRYRYSLLFRHRMQKFFTFFFITDWGFSLLFCVVNRC